MIISLSILAIYFIAIFLYILCIKEEHNNEDNFPFTDGYFAI